MAETDVAQGVDPDAYLTLVEEPWLAFARLIPALPLNRSEQRRAVRLVLEVMRRLHEAAEPEPATIEPPAARPRQLVQHWDADRLVRPQPSLARVAWLERPLVP